MMSDALQRRLMIISACVLTPLVFIIMPLTRPAMLATFAVFAHVILWIFDCAFGAEGFGMPPFVTWAFVGAIIGAALGYWSVAPAVGRRRLRRVAGAIPVTLIICLFVGDALVSITTAPKPPSLQPVAMQRAAPTKIIAKPIEDPNNEPAPGMYSTPKEDVLSTAPEGGGGDPKDSSVNMSPPVVPMSNHPNHLSDLAGRSVGSDHATVDPSPSPQQH